MVALVQTSSPQIVKRGDEPLTADDASKRRRRRCKPGNGRTVHFNEYPQTFEIPGRHVFSRQEISCMYISKAELARIQMEIVDTIREYRLCANKEHWLAQQIGRLRGLEPITNHDDGERISRVKGGVSAVIRQQMNGEIDEPWISKVYRPFSNKAHSLAHKRAMLDRESAFSDAPRMIVMAR
jgi:hypothetical protein